MYLGDDELVYRALFKKYRWVITEVVLIEGYTETSMGLEEYCCVDVVFRNGQKLLLDGVVAEQQDMVNRLLEKLKVEAIDWSQPFVFIDRTVLFSAG